MFILVAPGAWEPPRQFTDPGGRGNGANGVLEVATEWRDLVAVPRKVSHAPNHVQDLSLDCQDPLLIFSKFSSEDFVLPRALTTAFRDHTGCNIFQVWTFLKFLTWAPPPMGRAPSTASTW